MFLLRHNIRYAGTTAWTPKHLRFLGAVKMPFPAQQFALQELIGAITEAEQRLERFEAQVERQTGAGGRPDRAVRAPGAPMTSVHAPGGRKSNLQGSALREEKPR